MHLCRILGQFSSQAMIALGLKTFRKKIRRADCGLVQLAGSQGNTFLEVWPRRPGHKSHGYQAFRTGGRRHLAAKVLPGSEPGPDCDGLPGWVESDRGDLGWAESPPESAEMGSFRRVLAGFRAGSSGRHSTSGPTGSGLLPSTPGRRSWEVGARRAAGAEPVIARARQTRTSVEANDEDAGIDAAVSKGRRALNPPGSWA
jgi:hypothetical protein